MRKETISKQEEAEIIEVLDRVTHVKGKYFPYISTETLEKVFAAKVLGMLVKEKVVS